MQRGHILRTPDNLRNYFISQTHETTPKMDEKLTYNVTQASPFNELPDM